MKFRTIPSLVLLTALASSVAAAETKKPEGCSGEGHRPRGEKMFAHIDANSDGVITRSEFSGGAEKRFARFDANSDGSVTKEEFNQPPRGPRGGHAKKGNGTEGEKPRGDRPAPSAEQIERWKAHHEARFARLDKNSDGKVDQAEMTAEALARFKEIDADKNGVLTKTELQKHRPERQKGAE